MASERVAPPMPRARDDPRTADPRRLARPGPAASIRARAEDKAAFTVLLLELQLALHRNLTQPEAFGLLLAYAEGDTAGFLDWAARQDPGGP